MTEFELQYWQPKLSKDIRISRIDDNRFVITQTNLGFQLQVDSSTITLLKRFDGQKTLFEIMQVNGLTDINLFYNYLKSNLIEKGIIESELQLKKREKSKYLSIRFPLIKEGLFRV